MKLITLNIRKRRNTFRKYMFLYLPAIVFSFFNLQSSMCLAQVGTWKAYSSYGEPQQIVKAGDNNLFVVASNSLYQYNLTDKSITTYDKTKQLNDTYIEKIAWNNTAKRLIVIYGNSNIDLVDINGNVWNISGLYTKSMTQNKKVITIYMYEQYAYLSTFFGVVKVNMEKAEIAESYIMNRVIYYTRVYGDKLFVKDENENVLSGLLSNNLIDFHNWSEDNTYPSNLFDVDNSDWEQYKDLVATLKPVGPKYNHFAFMDIVDNKLVTCGNDGALDIGFIQNYDLENDEWTILNESVANLTTRQTGIIYSVAVDPADENHIYAGARIGLIEYRDNNPVTIWNMDNSPIETARDIATVNENSQRKYNLITSVKFDDEGNLWCLNSQAMTKSILKLNTKTNEWTTFDCESLMKLSSGGRDNRSLPNMYNMFTDSQGYIWFVCNHWDFPSLHWFNPKSSNINLSSVFTFPNQNGLEIKMGGGTKCVAEDLNHDYWIGTSAGPLLLPKEELSNPNPVFTQVVVPRNDGTNYADYLLNEVSITAIVIDKANRKWFGTQSNGVFVIGADNITQEEHFDTSNSPILSDAIISMAYNEKTGEIFFGTENGLCSYMSDAVESSIEVVKDNVYAYPNPVVSNYEGLISVVGLQYDSDVMVLTTSGQLVAQGRSKGGMFTWNGCDRQGRRVASGIYMVCAATSEGKKEVVCKIAVIR